MDTFSFSEIISNIDFKELHWISIVAIIIGILLIRNSFSLFNENQSFGGLISLFVGLIFLSIVFYFRYERSENLLLIKANRKKELIEQQKAKERLEEIEKEKQDCNIEMAYLKAFEFLERKQLPIIELISSNFLDNLRCEVVYVFRVKKMVYNGHAYVQGDKMYHATLTLGKFSGTYEFIDGDLYDPITKTVQQILK
ncbi:hypothetical protein [uncultured Sphingobacterium sp.]|uniref:hypothetical protein n=1 Tax=uncultured Sphingobacterium sp. TaxID=182688 RepID=UPI0037497ADA